MKTNTRRGVRATAALAVTGSLLGAQALTSIASADSTVVWASDRSAPANTGFWSNACPSANAEPANLHAPATLADDASSMAGTRTFVAGQNGLPDAAWQYTPSTANTEGGIALGALPLTTTGLSVAASGASTGRLLVMYTDSTGKQYVGEQQLTTTSGWQTVSAGTLGWWQYYQGGVYPWARPGSLGLNSNSLAATLPDFLASKGNGGTLSAAFELGCTGAFALDDLKVTDSVAGTTVYDLQNPASSTTTSVSASSIGPGGSASISGVVTLTSGGASVSDGTVTLQSSPDGMVWTDVATQPNGSAFSVAPTRSTHYRVNFNGAADAAASQSSNAVTVTVVPKLTLKTSRSTMNVGTSTTFTATFAPATAGIKIAFQQRSGTSWQGIGTATTNSSGVATLSKSRSASGLWTVRALASAQSGFAGSNAPSVTMKVYQPVSISIYRSYSTVYVGRTFRIYGTLTPHWSGIPVTLQQYLSGRWVTVATGKSGTRGGYSFTRTAHSTGTASFRVLTPASGYRRAGRSAVVRVSIIWAPVTSPPPPPPPPSGGGGSGIG